ncbi:N(G),N(G)-dimethylarginine dimethylaminohydrolase 1 [Fragariocoptes setiger]|uniref:N(G),N(G)-dimethylarginine dimethylaminohydrolase 1 n=1 Tax=Fragariocoptes setiger TaxID=1670756 RepID=A0ABQ7S981_9ACAR|nr:N(G),N(G)-dimethylarginine dimethylaminohydrolase 1 [Fragariocoptes setiger]
MVFYNYAICRRLCKPNKANGKAAATDELPTVDHEEAHRELQNYIATLRMLNVDVIELGPETDLQYESVFIGDLAVIINGMVLLCRPLHRHKEVEDIKRVITKEIGMPIVEIQDEDAILNGGDVLFTGKEIFIGLSSHTNEAGARAVAVAFPEFPVTPVKVPPINSMRLKSHITMAGPNILCAGRSHEIEKMLHRMEREASQRYHLIRVDDDPAANVLYVNGTLLHRDDYPKSFSIFQDRIDYSRVPVKITELCKNHPRYGLDSLCLLLRKSKRIQTIV